MADMKKALIAQGFNHTSSGADGRNRTGDIRITNAQETVFLGVDRYFRVSIKH